MSWIRMVYYPNPIKTQVVHESVLDIARRDVETRHEFLPESEHSGEVLHVDPGGMICVNVDPIPGIHNVDVKPEHITLATIVWRSHRKLEEVMPDGRSVFRVYLSNFICAVLPEDIYYEIGSWLAGLSAEGQIARMELSELLSGSNVLTYETAPLDEV